MSRRFTALTASCVLSAGLMCGLGCGGSGTNVAAYNPDSSSDTSQGSSSDTGAGTTTGTGGTVGATSSGVAEVSIKGFVISPKTITITAGQTVRWTSHDFTTHAIRSGDPTDADAGSLFESGIIGINGTYEFKFDTPGTYKYHCKYHYSRADEHDESVIVLPAN